MSQQTEHQKTEHQQADHQQTKCQQTVLIQNRLGLHARAAIKLVELAQSFDAVITISADDREVTADSVMGLLLLDSAQGQYIDITAEGSQAEQALSAMCALIEQKFDEEE